MAGLVGTPVVFWSVTITALVSSRRMSACMLCVAASLAMGGLTARAAIKHYHLDQVVAIYAARRAEACQKFEQAIAEGTVISLSRDVVHDILRLDCDYQKFLVAGEQPGSRLKFVTRHELGPRALTQQSCHQPPFRVSR